MKISRLSASRLQIFKECPYRYKLKYDDQIPPLKESPAAEFGKWIHKGLELAVKDNRDVKDTLREYVNDFKFSTDYLDRVPTILENFHKRNRNLPAGKTEFEFEMDAGCGVPLVGVIDRLIVQENKCMVLDYKTGRFQKSRKSLQTDAQLLIYSYAAHQLTDIPYESIHLSLLYLLSGKVLSISYQWKDVELFLRKAAEEVHTIQNMPPEKAKPQIHYGCSWCEYRDICEANKKYKSIRNR